MLLYSLYTRTCTPHILLGRLVVDYNVFLSDAAFGLGWHLFERLRALQQQILHLVDHIALNVYFIHPGVLDALGNRRTRRKSRAQPASVNITYPLAITFSCGSGGEKRCKP